MRSATEWLRLGSGCLWVALSPIQLIALSVTTFQLGTIDVSVRNVPEMLRKQADCIVDDVDPHKVAAELRVIAEMAEVNDALLQVSRQEAARVSWESAVAAAANVGMLLWLLRRPARRDSKRS